MEESDRYFSTVGEHALLTREEEIALSNLIRSGDDKAREKMILANLKFVVKIARGYMGLGLPLLDLVQEGNIGLMKAVEKFNPAFGAKFSTYGAWWIHQKILRALCDQGRLIRLPMHILGKLLKMRRRNGRSLGEEFRQYQHEQPEPEDHGFSERQLENLRAASQSEQLVWLDAPVGDDEAVMGDFIAEELEDGAATELTDRLGLNGNLATMVGGLSRTDRIVLAMRFGLNGATPKTLDDIAKLLGVTREAVRKREIKCLRKLRSKIETLQREREAEVPNGVSVLVN